METDDDVTAEAEARPAPTSQRVAAGPTMDKRALLKRVVTTTGVPAQQARKLLDSVLTEMASALDSGHSLALPPLGRLRAVRKADQEGKAVHTLRLRRSPIRAAAAADGTAEASPGAQARARATAGAGSRRVSTTRGSRGGQGKTSRSAAPVEDGDDDA